jgi:hypothetical protein
LIGQQVSVFLAATSLQPGEQWSAAVLNELRGAPWVIFLASKAVCPSPSVLQEVGGALVAKKNIIPIVWDMPASALPGWTQQYQALDLARTHIQGLNSRMSAIAEHIKADKNKGLLLAGLIVAGLLFMGTRE